jgi:hypothetical protein
MFINHVSQRFPAPRARGEGACCAPGKNHASRASAPKAVYGYQTYQRIQRNPSVREVEGHNLRGRRHQDFRPPKLATMHRIASHRVIIAGAKHPGGECTRINPSPWAQQAQALARSIIMGVLREGDLDAKIHNRWCFRSCAVGPRTVGKGLITKRESHAVEAKPVTFSLDLLLFQVT